MKPVRAVVILLLMALTGCASNRLPARMAYVSESTLLYSHLFPAQLPASVLGRACATVQDDISSHYSRKDVEVLLLADRGALKMKILSRQPITREESDFIAGRVTPALFAAIEEENRRNEK